VRSGSGLLFLVPRSPGLVRPERYLLPGAERSQGGQALSILLTNCWSRVAENWRRASRCRLEAWSRGPTSAGVRHRHRAGRGDLVGELEALPAHRCLLPAVPKRRSPLVAWLRLISV
jgi:hypothetical protein